MRFRGGVNFLASLRVLLVDAKRATRRAWREVLESTFPGCTVEEIAGATEAWGRVRTREYGLVVADALLPDGSGLELLERTAAACPDAVRVLLADPEHPEAARAGLRHGVVHGIIPKHAHLADATRALRGLVEPRT